MADDDEEEGFGGAYEQGHWIWDTSAESLVFVSDRPPEVVDTVTITAKAPTGTIEFKDDIDLIEQLRFRKRYQRKLKPSQPDIITIQDVKDLALYTAPIFLLSPMLIDMLHLSTTERFIRALIFYCQYYLQVADIMAVRMLEQETKVRTAESERVEDVYKENLSDLRAVVAKEYCTMLIGGSDTKKFHHMGPQKKRRSLSDKDARLFETLLRMCIQIVWLALGRRCYNQLELEVNRIFKSNIFNSVEHTLNTDYINKMAKEERNVLLGACLRHDQKLNTGSPVMNEVFCPRPIDYRLMGLGVIKYPQLHIPRLLYIFYAIAGPEEQIVKLGVSCGILGYPRAYFDTMLKLLPHVGVTDQSTSKSHGKITSGSVGKMSKSKTVTASAGTTDTKSSSKSLKNRNSLTGHDSIYPSIDLPSKHTATKADFPPTFPDEDEVIRRCSETQRRKWQSRLQKLLHPPKARRSLI